MVKAWNVTSRASLVAEAAAKEYDLLIVGGGINGAGLAREAALRGISFLLLDKSDFGFGTSSRSSKLAHGGFRYLSNGEFGLVRESETERNWLREAFPNLVRPAGFLYNAWEKGRDKPFHVRFGLTFYNILSDWGSRHKNWRKPRYLPPAFLEELEPDYATSVPGLGRVKLSGLYYDTNVDDARLALETLKEALELSGGSSAALSYAKVTGFTRGADGKVRGAIVADTAGGAEGSKFEAKARAVAVCAGVWNDEVMRNTQFQEERIYPTKGVHIVVESSRIGNRNCFGIRSLDDGRFFFVLRRGRYSVIGTTDTDYYRESRNLDEPVCTKADCDYLLSTVNRLFPHARLGYSDIVGTYAGIRPLIKSAGAKNESAVSREHAIFESTDGVFAIAGGKLTTYRLMSEELLFRMAGSGALPAFTERAMAQKGYSKRPFMVGATRAEFDAELDSRGWLDLVSPEQMEQLHRQYGWQALDILAEVLKDPASGAALVEGYPYCRAEMEFIARNEMVVHLVDVLVRRTEAQWQVWRKDQAALAAAVAEIVGAALGWDAPRIKAEIEDYISYVGKSFWF